MRGSNYSQPAESEKPSKHPSIAIGKVFLVQKVFAWICNKLIKIHFREVSGHSGNFLETLDNFLLPWKISGLWKVSGQSGKFTDTLENFPDNLKSFQNIWKVLRISGKFPESLESFRNL